MPARLGQNLWIDDAPGFSTHRNIEKGFDGFYRYPDPAFEGETRNMRSENDIVQLLEGVVGSRRFFGKDIETGPGDFLLPEALNEGCLIDDASP